MLKKAGYDVFEAVNGQQVIADSFHQKYSLEYMNLVIVVYKKLIDLLRRGKHIKKEPEGNEKDPGRLFISSCDNFVRPQVGFSAISLFISSISFSGIFGF